MIKKVVVGEQLKYRSDIDGLRAVAVLLVLLYHFEIYFSGGFIGVDVFFVISGYLIATKIRDCINAGEFSFFSFWTRRINRLLPSALLVACVTVFISYFIFLPEDFKSTAASSGTQTVFASNIYFFKTIDYFTSSKSAFPLLHYWSLSVEEQFYLIVPFLLVLIAKWKAVFAHTVVVLAVVGSLALCVYGSYRYASPNYYLLPFRAWEMGLGLMIPMLSLDRYRLTWKWLADTISVLALVMIVASGILMSRDFRFPSEWALLPTLGAMVYIWVGIYHQSWVAKLLSLKPVVFIGLISYPLYLWHWPLWAFFTYPYFGDYASLGWWKLLPLGLSVLLAYGTYRWVEGYFRSPKQRMFKFKFSLVGSVLACALAGGIYFLNGFEGRVSRDVLEYRESGRKLPNQFVVAQRFDEQKLNRFGAADVDPSVGLLGDSHAGMYQKQLSKEFEELGVAGYAFVCSATPPALDFIPSGYWSAKEHSPEYHERVRDVIIKKKLHTVIMAAQWSCYAHEDDFGTLREGVKKFIKELENEGIRVVIVGQPPSFVGDVKSKVVWAKWKGLEWSSVRQNGFLKKQYALLQGVVADENFVDVYNKFKELERPWEKDGRLLYSDSNHLSASGVSFVLPMIIRHLRVSSEQ